MEANFWYPQSEENAYLNQLNNAGDVQRQQITARGQDSADTTRAIGQIYSEAPDKIMRGVASGQDFMTKKANTESNLQTAQQARDIAQSEEGRQGKRFENDQTKFQNDQTKFQNDQTEFGFRKNALQSEESNRKRHDDYMNQGADPRDIASFHLQPGATRADTMEAQQYAQGGANLQATRSNTAASEASRGLAAAQVADLREQKALAQAQVEIDSLVSQPDSPQKSQQVADIAARYKVNPNLIAAASKTGTRNFLAQQASTKAQQDTAAYLNPHSAAVREEATKLKNAAQSLVEMKNAAEGGYEGAAASGGAFSSVKNNIPGWKSQEQEGLQQKAAADLDAMGEHGLAATVREKTFDVPGAIDIAQKQAASRLEEKLRALVNSNDTLAKDTVVQEAFRYVQQLKAASNGRNAVNVVNGKNSAPAAPSWVSQSQGMPQGGAQLTGGDALNPITGGAGMPGLDPLTLENMRQNAPMPAKGVR